MDGPSTTGPGRAGDAESRFGRAAPATTNASPPTTKPPSTGPWSPSWPVASPARGGT